VHLYIKKISAYFHIALAAIVKIRTRSPKKGSERTRLCTPKVILEVNFPKYLWGCCAPEELRNFNKRSILQFFCAALDGATAKPQIQNRIFWSIFYQFEEG